jgi:hypothetical protein
LSTLATNEYIDEAAHFGSVDGGDFSMGIFSRLFGADGDQEPDETPDPTQVEPPSINSRFDLTPTPTTANNHHESPKPTVSSTDDPSTRPRAPLPRLPRRAAAEPEPVVAAPTKKPDKHDETMVMTPPPAAAPTPRPPGPQPQAQPIAAREPIPPAPMPRWSRKKSDSIAEAFERSQINDTHVPPTSGVSTTADLAAVRGVFNDVAAVHMAQVRDVMLELRYGDAEPAWMESTKPALKSLRTMAAQMDLNDLCVALDEFCAAVETGFARLGSTPTRANDDVLGAPRTPIDHKAELLRLYQRLVELIPQAFELDGERDRREPIIIEALLFQIDGVERPIVDKLFSVGLSRFETLIRANVDELVAVSGIRREVATAIVDQLRTYRTGAQAVLSAPDPMTERRQLHDLLIMMSLQHDDFVRASTGWTDEARASKRGLRRQREQTYQRIKLSLARLGEREQLASLERLPFGERIATLDRYLSAPRPHA